MKAHRTIMIVSILAVFTMAGCEKGSAIQAEIDASVDTSAKLVTRAKLIDALWEAVEDVDPDAACLAESSFTIDRTNGITIMLNPKTSDYNVSDVVVTSSINISMPDPNTDGRGLNCGDGQIRYIVTASEEAPIDIEAADKTRGRYRLEGAAESEPKAYPLTCSMTVHFEPQEVTIESATPFYSADEAETEEAASESGTDETAEDETTDGEDEAKYETVNSIKLVIENYDCTVDYN